MIMMVLYLEYMTDHMLLDLHANILLHQQRSRVMLLTICFITLETTMIYTLHGAYIL